MRKPLYFATWFLTAALAARADGHGTPIRVQVVNDKLAVSGGLPDTIGVASMIFAEDDGDGDPFATLTLPSLGPVIIWDLPGFELVGLDSNSNLSIEVIAFPVKGSSPLEQRALWYWNPTTELVEPAPTAMHLLGTGQRFTTISPTEEVAPTPFLLADPVAGQQGFHNHGLIKYALDDSPPAPAGAYGYFARLSSDAYTPSDPFLIVINHGIDYLDVVPAALAINAAAADPEIVPIPGDYDQDGQVDADDYTLWKMHFGEARSPYQSPDGNGNAIVDAADYTIWRDNLGHAASGATAAPVPEPPGLLLIMLTLAAVPRPPRRSFD